LTIRFSIYEDLAGGAVPQENPFSNGRIPCSRNFP
jgi:hypothetical protein